MLLITLAVLFLGQWLTQRGGKRAGGATVAGIVTEQT